MEPKKLESGIYGSNQETVEQYFDYYGKLSNQQNMMQDYIRTGLYHDAITKNYEDFKGKIVMDVGAGSGILSLFAAKAGAKKVYAIEASSVASAARVLAKGNDFSEVIEVVEGRIEDLDLKEIEGQVDVLVSEPLGTMLFNERMLETYIIARNRFLRPGGKMFPSSANLCIAPFYDAGIYEEQLSKSVFWNSTDFYGFDMTSLKSQAIAEKFSQPIIEAYDPKTHLALECRHPVDFTSCTLEELQDITFRFTFEIKTVGLIHGVGVWFDVFFRGSQQLFMLSTSPSVVVTHWYQTRLLLPVPLGVNPGQKVAGVLAMKYNTEQSLDVRLELELPEFKIRQAKDYDLKNPDYRWNYQNPLAF